MPACDGTERGGLILVLVSHCMLVLFSRCIQTSIGNGHFRHRETVESVATVVCDIVQHEAFAVIEAHAEAPLLPGHGITDDIKGGALGLLHDIRLEISAQRLVEELVGVLDRWHGLPWLRFDSLTIGATGKIVHADQLAGDGVEDRRELAGQRVLVVLRVVVGHDIHVALR